VLLAEVCTLKDSLVLGGCRVGWEVPVHPFVRSAVGVSKFHTATKVCLRGPSTYTPSQVVRCPASVLRQVVASSMPV